VNKKFSQTQQFQQPNLSGKKHLTVSAQIVPGAEAAAVDMQTTVVLSHVVTPAVETKRFLFLGLA